VEVVHLQLHIKMVQMVVLEEVVVLLHQEQIMVLVVLVTVHLIDQLGHLDQPMVNLEKHIDITQQLRISTAILYIISLIGEMEPIQDGLDHMTQV